MKCPLPFKTFNMKSRTSTSACEIMGVLENNEELLLIRAVHEDPFEITWWIGGFAYEEGIGGRKALNAQRIVLFWVLNSHKYDFKFTNGMTPSKEEIDNALKTMHAMKITNDDFGVDFSVPISGSAP